MNKHCQWLCPYRSIRLTHTQLWHQDLWDGKLLYPATLSLPTFPGFTHISGVLDLFLPLKNSGSARRSMTWMLQQNRSGSEPEPALAPRIPGCNKILPLQPLTSPQNHLLKQNKKLSAVEINTEWSDNDWRRGKGVKVGIGGKSMYAKPV